MRTAFGTNLHLGGLFAQLVYNHGSVNLIPQMRTAFCANAVRIKVFLQNEAKLLGELRSLRLHHSARVVECKAGWVRRVDYAGERDEKSCDRP